MAVATHLTASMRVIRAHLKQRHVSIGVAQEVVMEAALRVGTGDGTAADARLEEQLLKATGCTLAELAVFAEDWPG